MLGEQFSLREGGEVGQRLPIDRRELTRLQIEDAERAEAGPLIVDEGVTSVGSKPRSPHHDRQLRDARILQCVVDRDDLIRLDGEPADRLVARQLGDAPTGRRLEPLLVFVEQRDCRDRRVQSAASDARDPLEPLFDRRVEEVESMDIRELERCGARDCFAEEGVAHECPAGQPTDAWEVA